jgi:hypothetical protein
MFLIESLDSKFDVLRHSELEDIINDIHKDKIFVGHTKVMQSPHMKLGGVSVVRFMGKPLKQMEYHIHNENSRPGVHVEPDRKSILHAIKIIHDDASEQIKDYNRSIFIHAANSEQYLKYLQLGRRLALKHNQKLKELGMLPYTTDNTKSGPAFVIREESEYVDFLGRKFVHIEEQILKLRNL